MPKYLFQASYTVQGLQGLLKEGGSARKANLEQLVNGMGGTVEALYYSYGDSDIVVIVDLPDDVTASALSMAVNVSGAVTNKTTVLLAPETIDEAVKKTVAYRAPGQ